jgi:CRISPR/Cas system-associated exonuclease Cas4 (RecB family)
MMKLVLDNLTSNRIHDLEKSADDKIHIRGYNPKHDVPVDFRNSDWFVPFNHIPIKYCPTDRYSYLHKYDAGAKRQQTWASLSGKILDNAYDQFIKKLHEYLNSTTLKNADIMNDFQSYRSDFIKNATSLIETEKTNIINFPDGTTIKKFNMLLEQTLRYETQMASALLDYRISITKDMNIKSMPLILFPFVPKPSYTVSSFGITDSAQPDFLFNNKIIIDVKSPPWKEEYLNTLGGYALVYEKMNNQPMNLGMIVTPEFASNRKVPHFFNSEVILIEDRYRNAFLLRRQNLLEQMKSKKDPGKPDSDEKCKSCTYFNHCWPSS